MLLHGYQDTPRARPSVKLWSRSARTSKITLARDCDCEPSAVSGEAADEGELSSDLGPLVLFFDWLEGGEAWVCPHDAPDGISLLTRFSDKKKRRMPAAT